MIGTANDLLSCCNSECAIDTVSIRTRIPHLRFEMQFLLIVRRDGCPKILPLLESLMDIHHFPELAVPGIPPRTRPIYDPSPSHPPVLNMNVPHISVPVRKVDGMRFRMDSLRSLISSRSCKGISESR